MEVVLEWMDRLERAVNMYHLADYERTMDEFKFNEEMARWVAQNPVGVERWQRIWTKMRDAEWKRDQAWSEIYRLDQHREFLNRHLVRR
jgi:hypothetical protein